MDFNGSYYSIDPNGAVIQLSNNTKLYKINIHITDNLTEQQKQAIN